MDCLDTKSTGIQTKDPSFKIFRGLELLYQFWTCTVDCKTAYGINIHIITKH